MENRDQFTSRLGMILATIGSAAGVGNIWRFPYIAGENGGGIFVLFYLLIIIIIGWPLLTLEISLGTSTKKNPVGAYKKLSPDKPWFLNGYLNVIAGIFIVSYTLPVYGWILKYAYEILMGTFVNMAPGEVANYFNNFMGNKWQVLFWVILNILLILFVVRKKLQDGVEKIAKILLPVLAVMFIVLIIRAVTLEGAMEGLSFYLKPDFAKFSWSSVFVAIGQAFFSLGLVMGAALVFGSYLKNEDKKLVPTSGFIVLADSLVAIMAGLVIFPSVSAFGLEPASGPALTFITMPNVFNNMPAGILWGFIFYVAFYIAAFTSAVAVWEGVIAFIKDEFGFARKKAVWTTLGLVAIVGLPSVFSMKFFNMIDYLENNFVLIFGGFFMTIFVGWVWGTDNFAKEANIKSKSLSVLWKILIKYIIPLIIIAIFLNSVIF
ncbi:MAG TPA: sodium-dependent transporter [Halanaerobiales bacterium]|nr:sodium-dependent transporter [Halanaerobiales bacterium]